MQRLLSTNYLVLITSPPVIGSSSTVDNGGNERARRKYLLLLANIHGILGGTATMPTMDYVRFL